MLNINIVIFLKEKLIKSCFFVIFDEYMYFNCMCNNFYLLYCEFLNLLNVIFLFFCFINVKI